MKDKVNQQDNIPKKTKNLSYEEKYFIGGLFEGDASFYVSLKKNPSSRFKVYVDPGFALYQHKRGYELLQRAQILFATGRIEKKPGSENVYQFIIVNRRSILEKVIPFYRKYVYPFSAKKESFDIFQDILQSLDKKDHHTEEGMIRLLEKVYKISVFTKGKKRVSSLDEIISLVKSSETTRLKLLANSH